MSERNRIVSEVPSFADVVEAFDRLRDLFPTIRDLGRTAVSVKEGLGELTGVTIRYVAHEVKSKTTSVSETVGHRVKWGVIDAKRIVLNGLKRINDDSPHLGDR